MQKLIVLVATALVFSFPIAGSADDVNQIFSKVNEYITQKNYPKALEELQWAKQEIEKMNTAQLKSFFPDQLAGFTGGKLETNGALGFTSVERSYTKSGDPSKVKVSLTGGGGSAAGALGGLAAFGKMAAMMGAQEGGSETVRISGRTAQMQANDDSKSAELTVFLDSGSILKFEMNNSSSATTLKSLAEAININGLDSYLKGQAPAAQG